MHVMNASSIGNTYLQDESPWAIWKNEPDSDRIKECIINCLGIVNQLSALIQPFLPETASKIRKVLNLV